MSQPFTFPPPPPPPPKKESTPNSYPQPYSQPNRGGGRGRAGFRGDNRQRGSGQRGRGRGFAGASGRGTYSSAAPAAYGAHSSNVHSQSYEQKSYGHTSPDFNRTTSIGPQKRDHASAFSSSSTLHSSRPKAPPAVPSYDLNIEDLLPKRPENRATSVATTSSKGNLLGLTPSKNVHDSESDGEDDEVKLASTIVGGAISFEHQGQKLSLSSPAEIAAWIAERRTKFPTQVKADAAKKVAEEKKRKWEEQKKANMEAGKLRREEREKERNEREMRKLKEKLIAAQIQKSKAVVAEAKVDPAEKARLRAEKLRKRAEKAAEQLRDAEAALERARTRQDQQNHDTKADLSQSHSHGHGSGLVEDTVDHANSAVPKGSDMGSDVDSSDDSEDDETSSSGTSGSDSDIDSDSAPEESSSKRDGPERVAPPKRVTGIDEPRLCRNLVKFGKCKYGKKCRFSHDVPPRKETGTVRKQSSVPTPRKGLYQIMIEKEEEEERKQALRAIIALGGQGLLADEPKKESISSS